MAEHSYLDPDFDFNSLQFLDNPEIEPLFSDNFFADCLMEDSSSTSLLGVPSYLIDETAHISGPEIFIEDANVYLPGDLVQSIARGKNVQQPTHSATNSRSESDLTVIQTGNSVLPAFPSDPAFVERAVQYSSFEMENCQITEKSSLDTTETITSVQGKETTLEPSISGNDNNYSTLRKRKTIRKAAYTKAAKGKRWKGADNVKDAIAVSKYCPEKTKDEISAKTFPAPLKPDHVHVRARRGEASDRHRFAERARRNKISERMRFLQYLVPGCSNIKGKALILEEIINHIQSLHRQVEFLSMKTATVSPRFDIDNHHIYAKDITTGCPPNDGISADLMPSPYLQCEQPEQSNVCFPMVFQRENPPPILFHSGRY